LSGPETAQAIRLSGEPWAGVPIVALTGHTEPQAMQAARVAGMNGYLVKPVDMALLCETLRSLLGGALACDPATSGDEPMAMLDAQRLQDCRQQGTLEELLGACVPEIRRLVDALEQAAACHDLRAALQAMHSLLGTSGAAGATALHQLVLRTYVPMLEHDGWPQAPDWLARIQALAAQTDQAFRDCREQ